MAGINKAIIVGNLGQEPKVHVFESGDKITTFSVATSESWTDKSTGEKKEKTEWHNVVLRGKLADIGESYLSKGSKVYLEGKITTRKWQDQNGQDRYSTEIVVGGFGGVMQMLDSRLPENPGSRSADPQPQQQSAPGIDQDIFNDDIPF